MPSAWDQICLAVVLIAALILVSPAIARGFWTGAFTQAS